MKKNEPEEDAADETDADEADARDANGDDAGEEGGAKKKAGASSGPANDAAGDDDADAEPAPRKKRARRTAPAPETAEEEASAAKPRAPRKRSAATSAAAAPSGEPDVAPAGVTVAQEKAARRALTGGATLAVAGLMLVGIGPSDAGMAVCLGGLVTLIYGIHTYGRLGPEAAR